MIDLKKHKKTIYLSLFFLAVIATISFFITLPLINQIKESGQELAQSRQLLDNFYQNWQDLKKSKKEIEKIRNDLTKMQPFLAKNEALKFIESLEDISQKTNNVQKINVLSSLVSIDAQSVKDKKAADVLDFQISLAGDFSALMKFLVSLENLSYCNEIKSIHIDKLDSHQNEGTIESISPAKINTSIDLSVMIN